MIIIKVIIIFTILPILLLNTISIIIIIIIINTHTGTTYQNQESITKERVLEAETEQNRSNSIKILVQKHNRANLIKGKNGQNQNRNK